MDISSTFALDYNYYNSKTYEYFIQLHSDVTDIQLYDTWIN